LSAFDFDAVQKEVNKLMNNNLKSNETIAKEVIQGKWHNGDKRKGALTQAGYNYEEIQKIVNRMMQ